MVTKQIESQSTVGQSVVVDLRNSLQDIWFIQRDSSPIVVNQRRHQGVRTSLQQQPIKPADDSIPENNQRVSSNTRRRAPRTNTSYSALHADISLSYNASPQARAATFAPLHI